MFLRVRDKKALSNLVAYTLLIAITLALSVLVYNWLRHYVETDELAECPEGVNIIISDYTCIGGQNKGYFTFTVSNKGLFAIDGFRLRIHDREDPEFGLYSLGDINDFDVDGESKEKLMPGEKVSLRYNFGPSGSLPQGEYLGKVHNDLGDMKYITLIEVQPLRFVEGKITACDARAIQHVIC